MNKMTIKIKTLINFSAVALLIGSTSCGSSDELERLETQKTELNKTITESETKLDEVNLKILELKGHEKIDYPDVTIAIAKKEVFEHYISIQGQIEAGNMVMVTPEVGGIITSLNAKEGQSVSQGQVIATFDSKTIASTKAEIKAQYDLAEKMYKKQKSLYDQGIGNIINLDQAEGQMNALKKSLHSMDVQGGKFKVKAPFSGIIEKVYVVKGQVAGPGSPIILLVGNKERKVVANISETYLQNLYVGALVGIDFPALGTSKSDLKITRIGGFVDPVNRTITMEVDLPKVEAKLVPNLMANIKIRDMVDSNALIIPSKVILKGSDQNSYVYALKKDNEKSDSISRYTVVKKNIETGSMYQGKTVVLSGLNPGETIVNRGKSDVYVGTIVEIAKD